MLAPGPLAIGALTIATTLSGVALLVPGEAVPVHAGADEAAPASQPHTTPAAADQVALAVAPAAGEQREQPVADRDNREWIRAQLLDSTRRRRAEAPRDPLRSTDLVLADRRINPAGRRVDDEHREQMLPLVRLHALRVAVAAQRAASLREAALQRSLEAGRFVSRAVMAKSNGCLPITDGLDQAVAASGLSREHLRCSNHHFATPDGVLRHVVTYVTRNDEPDYFFAAELVDQLRQQQQRELRAFVATR